MAKKQNEQILKRNEQILKDLANGVTRYRIALNYGISKQMAWFICTPGKQERNVMVAKERVKNNKKNLLNGM